MKATCVYHKIRLPGRLSKYSAWFDFTGFFVDCERIDARGRSYPCTTQEMADLQRGGWSSGQYVEFN